MKSTIDAAGRIVVPKSLRQALGLKAGQPVEIRAGDGRLEIEIAPTPMRLKKRGKGVVAVPDARLPALTAEEVRDTLERVRRCQMRSPEQTHASGRRGRQARAIAPPASRIASVR